MTTQSPPSPGHMTDGPSVKADDGRVGRSTLGWALPGLAGGVAFLTVIVLGGALVGRPWAAPDAIAAVLGVKTRGYPAQVVPVLIGVGTHLGVSVILGALYLVIARRLRLRGWWIVLGGWLFSGMETPVSLWGILHTFLAPGAFDYYLDAVPFWVSFVGHTVYGLVLGGLAVRIGPVRIGPVRRL